MARRNSANGTQQSARVERVSDDDAGSFAYLRQAFRANQAEPVPEGWYTADEWAKLMGCGGSEARKVIRHFRAKGEFEQKRFRIESGDRVYPVPHYRKVK